MTDIAPDAAPTTDVAAAITADADWQAKYQQEVEHRKRERNLYAPVAKVIEGLADTDRDAIVALADAVRAGDSETVINWALQSAEAVSGKSVADLIAERQKASAAPVDIAGKADTPTTGVAPEQITDIVKQALAERDAELEQKARVRALVDTMSAEMRAAGLEPSSDEGKEVIRMARALAARDGREPDIKLAIRVYQTAKAAEAAGIAGAAEAAAAVPSPAPAGAPAGSAPANLTPRERVMARLGSKPA